MSLKKLLLALAMAMAFTAAVSGAETTIGAKVFYRYGLYNLGGQQHVVPTPGGVTTPNSFYDETEVDRIMFMASTKIDDVWSFKFLLESSNDTGPYVKFGFVKAQISKEFAINFGVVPVVELGSIKEGMNMRWLDKPLIYRDTRKAAFKGPNANALYSGTLGITGSVNIAKVIKIDLQVDTGENQFSNILTEADSDKSIALNVGITPVGKLYIGLFGRVWVGVYTDYGSTDFWYAGLNLSWRDKFYKFGTNWAVTSVSASYHNAANMWVAGELYANINLKNAITVPLLVIARIDIDFNQQMSDKLASSWPSPTYKSGNGLAGLSFAVGLGYQFNNNVQVGILYRGTASRATVGGDEILLSDLTFQSEVKF